MIEVAVSLSIVGVMLAALSLFAIQTLSVSRKQSDLQLATQYATAAMERASQLPGTALLVGRTQTGVSAQWRAPGVSTYLANTEVIWDTTGTTPAPEAARLPTTPETIYADGQATRFQRSYYVAACWQRSAVTDCVVVPSSQRSAAIAMYRVVVAISWRAKECTNSTCAFVTTALAAKSTADPTFSN